MTHAQHTTLADALYQIDDLYVSDGAEDWGVFILLMDLTEEELEREVVLTHRGIHYLDKAGYMIDPPAYRFVDRGAA